MSKKYNFLKQESLQLLTEKWLCQGGEYRRGKIKIKYMKNNTFFIFTFYLSIIGCNKKFDAPDSLSRHKEITNLSISRKVLMIEIDGISGSELELINTPNITKLRGLGLYSNASVSGYAYATDNNNYKTWASQLTGVLPEKTGITNNEFSGLNLTKYPTIFQRLKQHDSSIKTVAYTSTDILGHSLCKDADALKVYDENEENLTTDLLMEIEITKNSAAFIYAQYGSVDKAGSMNHYLAADKSYENAILKIDKYIGLVYNKITTRPTFKNENWLVILCSNKGGNTDINATSVDLNWVSNLDSRFRTFFVMANVTANPKVLSQEIGLLSKTEENTPEFLGGSSVRGFDDGAYLEVKTAGNLYDIGEKREQTIHFKVACRTESVRVKHVFLSKREGFEEGSKGWYIYLSPDGGFINIGQNGKPDKIIKIFSHDPDVPGASPRSIFIVFRTINGRRYINSYVGGNLYTADSTNDEYDISEYGSIDNAGNLKIGTSQLPIPDFSIPTARALGFRFLDLRIYNTILSPAYISKNHCNTYVQTYDPYFDNLLANWPLFNTHIYHYGAQGDINNLPKVFSELIVSDISKYRNDIIPPRAFIWDFTGAKNMEEFTRFLCFTIRREDLQKIYNNADYYIQILAWFGILVPDSWQLDGKQSEFNFF